MQIFSFLFDLFYMMRTVTMPGLSFDVHKYRAGLRYVAFMRPVLSCNAVYVPISTRYSDRLIAVMYTIYVLKANYITMFRAVHRHLMASWCWHALAPAIPPVFS